MEGQPEEKKNSKKKEERKNKMSPQKILHVNVSVCIYADTSTYKVLNSSAHLSLFQNNKGFVKYRQATYTATKRRCFGDRLSKVLFTKKPKKQKNNKDGVPTTYTHDFT